MGRVRRCDSRCHNARGRRCRCWCGGYFHGSAGSANREALVNGLLNLDEQAGFRQGETAYIEQQRMLLEVAGVK